MKIKIYHYKYQLFINCFSFSGYFSFFLDNLLIIIFSDNYLSKIHHIIQFSIIKFKDDSNLSKIIREDEELYKKIKKIA